jgi:hypothetical protein
MRGVNPCLISSVTHGQALVTASGMLAVPWWGDRAQRYHRFAGRADGRIRRNNAPVLPIELNARLRAASAAIVEVSVAVTAAGLADRPLAISRRRG